MTDANVDSGDAPGPPGPERNRWGRRQGPVIGYWWICRVQLPDGGHAEVDRSILTGNDVGRTVELHQACFDRPQHHCNLGREASLLGQLYAGI
jgi:hypothetical protein